MRFTKLDLAGAYVIDIEPQSDARGFFARSWSIEEFADRGLSTAMAHCSISFNERKGTLRGIHYQAAPFAEVKLVRCTAGAIMDVIVDLRPGSTTFTRWVAVELSADNRRQLYVPEGFGHGFQTLCDKSEVWYQISTAHMPESARGVRWNDALFAIDWPDPLNATMSERDRSYPDFAANV